MKKFFGRWNKEKENPRNKKYECKWSKDGIKVHLISTVIPIEKKDSIEICSIIKSSLEQERENYGMIIAKEIYKYMEPRAAAVEVNGDENGINWIVKIDTNPLEFVD